MVRQAASGLSSSAVPGSAPRLGRRDPKAALGLRARPHGLDGSFTMSIQQRWFLPAGTAEGDESASDSSKTASDEGRGSAGGPPELQHYSAGREDAAQPLAVWSSGGESERPSDAFVMRPWGVDSSVFTTPMARQ